MSQILSKTVIKLMTSSVVWCNYVILCFGVKVQLFTNFPIFRRIKLKSGGGVNSETLISYFMSILPYKMSSIKIKGFNVIFTKFIRPLFHKSVAMVTYINKSYCKQWSTHKLILKVKKFQLSSAKRFGTAEENLQGVDSTPPYHLG